MLAQSHPHPPQNKKSKTKQKTPREKKGKYNKDKMGESFIQISEVIQFRIVVISEFQ